MSWTRSKPSRAGLAWLRFLVMSLFLTSLSYPVWIFQGTPSHANADEGNDPDDAGAFRFLIPDVVARPGEALRVTVEGEHSAPAQGFSLAVRYPSDVLTIERIHAEETILEAIGTDFIEVQVFPEEGYFVVGVLVDTKPPFEGNVIPNIFRPLAFLHIEAVLDENADEDITLRLEDGLSDPPINNAFVVDNQAVPVTELTQGLIHLPFVELAAFVRGDVNLDEQRDISDAIAILKYQFSGSQSLVCMDAADTNDDRAVDISDSVFLLNYLFLGGRAPSPPSLEPGPDPTADDLDCCEPFFFLRILQ